MLTQCSRSYHQWYQLAWIINESSQYINSWESLSEHETGRSEVEEPSCLCGLERNPSELHRFPSHYATSFSETAQEQRSLVDTFQDSAHKSPTMTRLSFYLLCAATIAAVLLLTSSVSADPEAGNFHRSRRSADEIEEPTLVDKRIRDFLGKRIRDFLGKRFDPRYSPYENTPDKRIRDFLGKRSSYGLENEEDLAPYEKRLRDFLG